MSAFDPKRTVLNSNFIRSRWRKPIRCPNEAVAIAKTGATLDERDTLIRFMYGRALLARKSYSEALGELEIAAELNPNLAVVYCGLGDSLAYEGRIEEAVPYFQRAIDLSPHDPLL
ncbi:MAG: tetratricopeptide repeat protein, partial [Pseudolabrys sp.]